MKVVCGPPSAGIKRPASAPRRKGGKRARLDARPRVVAPDQARDAAAAVDAFLHEHQRASSAFVAERERPDASYARGGLILDGMGAGKTVSMLAPVALEVTAALLADAPVPRTLIVGTETCWIAWRNEWATLCERCGISAPVVEIKQRITADALNTITTPTNTSSIVTVNSHPSTLTRFAKFCPYRSSPQIVIPRLPDVFAKVEKPLSAEGFQ